MRHHFTAVTNNHFVFLLLAPFYFSDKCPTVSRIIHHCHPTTTPWHFRCEVSTAPFFSFSSLETSLSALEGFA